MMTLEIKINGVDISLVKIVNTGAEVKGEILYGVEAYVPDDEYGKGKLVSTSVGHNPKDGAIILCQKVINEVVKKL